MAAPIFDDDEVQFLMTCKKVASGDDAETVEQLPTRETSPGVLKNHVALVVPDAREIELITMTVEQTLEKELDAFSITLHAKLKNRVSQAFVRYDIHGGDHVYPNGLSVSPFQAHRHVYSTAMVAAGELIDWQRSPEIIDIGAGGAIRSMHERLKQRAIDDLTIEFHTDQPNLFLPRW